jgi:hypothetical protein
MISRLFQLVDLLKRFFFFPSLHFWILLFVLVNARDPKSHQNAMTGLLEAESHLLWSLHVAAYMNEVNRRANLLDDEAVSSSNQEELLLWVNDYK